MLYCNIGAGKRIFFGTTNASMMDSTNKTNYPQEFMDSPLSISCALPLLTILLCIVIATLICVVLRSIYYFSFLPPGLSFTFQGGEKVLARAKYLKKKRFSKKHLIATKLNKPPITTQPKLSNLRNRIINDLNTFQTPKYQHQGAELIVRRIGESISDTLVSYIEDIYLLLRGIALSSCYESVMIHILTFIKRFHEGPIVKTLIDYTKSMLEDIKNYVSQSYAHQSVESDKNFHLFINTIKSCKTSKVTMTESPIFKTTYALISNLVIHHLVSKADQRDGMCYTIAGFKMFSMKDMKRVSADTAMDFGDLLLDTIIHFTEGGYRFFQSGEINDIFWAKDEVFDFIKAFDFLNSRISIVESGNLDQLGCGIHDYDAKLSTAIETGYDLIKQCPKKDYFRHSTLLAKCTALASIQTRMIKCQKKGGLRARPYSIYVAGPSAIGKSDIATQLSHALLLMNGHTSTMESVITLNSDDKFASEYSTRNQVIILDDFCNSHLDYVQGNPAKMIIDIVNNVPVAVLKADADQKGNVYFNPLYCIVTSNIKNMCAEKISNDPASLLGRMNVHLYPVVLEQYRIDGTFMLDPSKIPPGMDLLDVWHFDVKRILIKPANQAELPSIPVFVFWTNEDGRIMKNIRMPELLVFLKAQTAKHTREQNRLLQNNKSMFEIKACEHGLVPNHCVNCRTFVSQSEEMDSISMGKLISLFYVTRCLSYCNSSFHGILFTLFFGSVTKQQIIQITQNVMYKISVFLILSAIAITNICKTSSYLEFAIHLCVFAFICVVFFLDIYDYAKSVNDTMAFNPKVFTYVANSYNSKYTKPKYIILLATAAIAIKTLYSLRRTFTEQGASNPKMKVDSEGKSIERKNIWKKTQIFSLPAGDKALTSRYEQIRDLLSTRIGHVFIERGDGTSAACKIFPVSNSVWIMPNHTLKEGMKHQFKVTIHDTDTIGRNFSAVIDESYIVRIAGCDMALVHLPQGGENRDITHLFPTKCIKSTCIQKAKIMFREEDGSCNMSEVFTKPDSITLHGKTYTGYSYELSYMSFRGLCMAPVISCVGVPLILGFHTAGIENTTTGFAATLTQHVLLEGIHTLSSRHLLALSEGTISTKMVGVETGPLGPIHPKSPLNFQEQGKILTYGAHSLGTRTQRSNVIPTLISDDVAEIMDLPVLHGKPLQESVHSMNGQYPWREDLIKLSNTTELMDPTFLELAYQDLEDKIFEHLDANPSELEDFHPYPIEVALAGFDGVFGVDPIQKTTSSGWPLNKPKTHFIEEGPEYEGIFCPLIADDAILIDVARIKATYLEGKRAYPVHRGNLKDEPTKLSKEKVRVFAGSQMSFLIIVRQYTLSFCRFIINNPYLWECAVTLNCYSGDWTRLRNHTARFGDHRIIAGDYAAFDSTMSVQTMSKAFQLMIAILKRGNYDADEIKILEGISCDLMYAFYEYNGEYLMVFGSNPSGNALTVFLNNIVNCLYMRYSYYFIYAPVTISSIRFTIPYRLPDIPRFDKVVSLMCYGDDNKSSVREGYDEYNHTAVVSALATCGIVYTMADKTSASVPYVHDDNADFLKRKAVWSDDIGAYKAPLDITSMQKSLHRVLRSKVLTHEQHSAEIILNVNREFFQYPRDIFDMRHAQLFKIAEKNNLVGYFGDSFKNYDEFLEERLST